jgi:hypothetical protein
MEGEEILKYFRAKTIVKDALLNPAIVRKDPKFKSLTRGAKRD